MAAVIYSSHGEVPGSSEANAGGGAGGHDGSGRKRETKVMRKLKTCQLFRIEGC